VDVCLLPAAVCRVPRRLVTVACVDLILVVLSCLSDVVQKAASAADADC
jgi:hypothetical protein